MVERRKKKEKVGRGRRRGEMLKELYLHIFLTQKKK